MTDPIDTASTGSPGGAVMENSFSLARVLGRVFPSRFVAGAPGSVVFGFGASSLLRLARTAVLLTLFATSLLAMTSSASADECPNETIRDEQHAHLSDCRAYEMVSPPDKNGADIVPDTQRTRAALDGGAVNFESLTGFGDVRGTAVSTDYMSVRATTPNPGNNGWGTHGITPPQSPLSLKANIAQLESRYVGELSPDLSRGIFLGVTPVSDDAMVANAVNLYRRSDLRAASAGNYSLLSPCPLCDATDTPLPPAPFLPSAFAPYLAGASADFSHIVFESRLDLTSDATPNAVNLYESEAGTVRLVGILPDGTAAASSIAGLGAGGGGSRQHYTPHVISANGARIFFTDPTTGNVYLRSNGATTVQLNASERTDCADQTPCTGVAEPDPRGTAPATYWNASVDGERSFFSTTEALTDNAPVDGAGSLYMYDASGTPGHHLKLISVNRNATEHADVSVDALCGVIGVSDDGRYVYFTALGQLTASGPLLGTTAGIYEWHDDGTTEGAVSFIGRQTHVFDGSELVPTTSISFGFLLGRVTPDGKYLLFSSHLGTGLLANYGPDFTDYDHGNSCVGNGFDGHCRELYVYSADTHSLACASCNPSGAAGTADATDVTKVNQGAAKSSWHVNRAIADDGRRVFFSTAEALVPEDSNGKNDVYEYDVASHTAHLISTGKDSADSYFLDASANGADVFFLTRERLVGWDTDTNYDIYDAREPLPGHPAGFPDPVVTPQCTGDSCLGPVGATPSVPPSGSAVIVGAGNMPSVPKKSSGAARVARCKRGYVRARIHGKTRCVKKRAKRARRAAHTGRIGR